MQVLSRVLAFAVDPLGKIASNPCEGIKQLYSVDRSETIWTDADIARSEGKPARQRSPHAVDLAAYTGLRLGDLLRLSWSHVGEDAIALTTGKSRHRREAIIPLYDDLRALLATIPKRATTILTNSRHTPWTKDGFGSSFNKAKVAAGIERACTSTTFAAPPPPGSTWRHPEARDRRDHGLGRGPRRKDRPALRRPQLRRRAPSSASSTKGEHEDGKPAAKPHAWIGAKCWSGRWESNPRHSAWEADVLPLNYARDFTHLRCSRRGP